jgi:hypothetical protein
VWSCILNLVGLGIPILKTVGLTHKVEWRCERAALVSLGANSFAYSDESAERSILIEHAYQESSAVAPLAALGIFQNLDPCPGSRSIDIPYGVSLHVEVSQYSRHDWAPTAERRLMAPAAPTFPEDGASVRRDNATFTWPE